MSIPKELARREQLADAPLPPDAPTPFKTMTHRLKTPEGNKLYGLRKHTPEPVFGIIKSALGSASSCSAGSTVSAASAASRPWPGT